MARHSKCTDNGRSPGEGRRFQMPPIWGNMLVRWFIIVFFLSNIGDWCQQIATTFLVLAIAHSSLALGVSVVLNQLPRAFISSLGGWLADRYSRRTMQLWGQSLQVVQSLILWGLQLTDSLNLWWLYLLILMGSVLRGLTTPARVAMLRGLTGGEGYKDALVLFNSGTYLSTILGSSGAGALVGFGMRGVLIPLNVATYIPVLFYLFRLKEPRRTAAAHRSTSGKARKHLTAPGVWPTLAMYFWVTFWVSTGSVNQPLKAVDGLGGSQAYSWLSAACAVGGLGAAAYQTFKRPKIISRWAFGWGAMFCLLEGLYGATHSLWQALVYVMLAYAGLDLFNVGSNVVATRDAENNIQGRVQGSILALSTAALAGGALMASTLATMVGITDTIVGESVVGFVGVAILWMVARRHVLSELLAQLEREFASEDPTTIQWLEGLERTANSIHKAIVAVLKNGNRRKIERIQLLSERLATLLTLLITEMDAIVGHLRDARLGDETVEEFLRRVYKQNLGLLDASIAEGDNLDGGRA